MAPRYSAAEKLAFCAVTISSSTTACVFLGAPQIFPESELAQPVPAALEYSASVLGASSMGEYFFRGGIVAAAVTLGNIALRVIQARNKE